MAKFCVAVVVYKSVRDFIKSQSTTEIVTKTFPFNIIKMLATVAAMVMIALSIRQCYSISQEEFEKTVETCGTAPFEDFEGQADMRRGEFPWNVLISYPEGEKEQWFDI